MKKYSLLAICVGFFLVCSQVNADIHQAWYHFSEEHYEEVIKECDNILWIPHLDLRLHENLLMFKLICLHELDREKEYILVKKQLISLTRKYY